MVDRSGHTIHWAGVNPGLTKTEYNVVTLMIDNAGRNVTYRALYDTVRGVPNFIAGTDGDGYRTNVRSMIKRIRRKFTAIDPTFSMIQNYQAVGYAWRPADVK